MTLVFFSKRSGAAGAASNIKVSTITGPGATGNVSYTGLGFRPSAILFQTLFMAVAQRSDAIFSLGAAASSTERWTSGYASDSGQNTSDTYGLLKTDVTLAGVSVVGGVTDIFDLVSMDADGFTLNWLTTSAISVYYMAFPEDVDAKVGSFNLNNSTGIQSITGVGFTPRLLFLTTAIQNTTEGAANDLAFCVGAATSPTERFAYSIKDTDALGTSDCANRLTDQSVFAMISTAAVTAAADLDAFNSDGFDLDITTAPAASIKVCYLALGGGQFSAKADTFLSDTATGNEAYTGFGFQPEALLFPGYFVATLGTISGDHRMMMGMTDGTNHAVMSTGARDNAAVTDTNSRQSTTAPVMAQNYLDGTDFGAGLTSLDADGYTLNWTAVQAAAWNAGVVAMRTT